MTPENALEILTQATGALAANREDHINIQMALDVFKGLIPPKPANREQRRHPKKK